MSHEFESRREQKVCCFWLESGLVIRSTPSCYTLSRGSSKERLPPSDPWQGDSGLSLEEGITLVKGGECQEYNVVCISEAIRAQMSSRRLCILFARTLYHALPLVNWLVMLDSSQSLRHDATSGGLLGPSCLQGWELGVQGVRKGGTLVIRECMSRGG